MPKDHLFALISSLSQTEKRYCKLYLQKHTPAKQVSKSIRMFEVLQQFKLYDKAELLKRCKVIAPGQLENMKHRLYANLLRGLRAYHAGKSGRLAIYQDLTNYEILFQKGLYSQSYKMLKRIERAGWALGQFRVLEDVLKKQEYLVMIRLKLPDAKQQLESIRERMEEVTALSRNLKALEVLYTDVYDVFRKQGRVSRDSSIMLPYQEKLDALVKDAAGNRRVLAIAFQQSFIQSLINQSLGRFAANSQMHEAFLEEFPDREAMMENYQKDYNRILNQQVISYNMNRRQDKAQEIIEQIREAAEHIDGNEELKLVNFENGIFQELEIYIHEGDFDQGIALVERHLDQIENYQGSIHSVNRQSKLYRITLAYFGAGRYRDALRWINRILNFDKQKHRLDIQSSLQLLNLLIHFELKNYDLLEYTIPTTVSHLKKLDRWLEVEKEVIGCLSRIVAGKRDQIEFQRLHERLQARIQEQPLDRYGMAYFDLLAWTKAKAERRSYDSVIRMGRTG